MPISRNAAATSSQLFDGGILAFAIAFKKNIGSISRERVVNES